MSKAKLLPLLALYLAGGAPAYGESDATGKAAFDRHCVHCHAPGDQHPGSFQLARTRGEDKAVLEARDDLSVEYIRHVVRHGLKAMPPFVPSALPDDQLEALTDYLGGEPANE